MDENKTQFEINLYPVISLLSVLICFLLLTTVWVQIGEMKVNKNTASENTNAQNAFKSEPRLVLVMLGDKSFEVNVLGLRKNVVRKHKVSDIGRKLSGLLNFYKKRYPNIKHILFQPQLNSNYQTVIEIMDVIKNSQFESVGLQTI